MESNSNGSSIDHLVMVAATLESGVQYVEDLLGVKMQQGGKHKKMGTHNCLLKLGDNIYLEVIAIDPQAPKPQRARWFGLDNISTLKRPKLVTWAARTENIEAATKVSGIEHETIQQMSRGDLEWLLAVPDEGDLPFDGVAPMLIEWKNNMHPCDNLEEKGCRLLKIEGFHADINGINTMLTAIGFGGSVVMNEITDKEQSHLIAYIQTNREIFLLT